MSVDFFGLEPCGKWSPDACGSAPRTGMRPTAPHQCGVYGEHELCRCAHCGEEFRGIEFEAGGRTYDAAHDGIRLARQLGTVYVVMKDAEWRTLSEIAKATGAPEASISARLRDFRKPENGAHQVNSRRRGPADAGLWEYQLKVNPFVRVLP